MIPLLVAFICCEMYELVVICSFKVPSVFTNDSCLRIVPDRCGITVRSMEMGLMWVVFEQGMEQVQWIFICTRPFI